MEKIKLVVDSNVWISFFNNKRDSHFKKVLANPVFEICSAQKQVDEIISVLNRTKFKKYFSPGFISSLIDYL